MKAAGRAFAVLAILVLSGFLTSIGAAPQVAEKMTPLLLAVQDAPIPFMGSDGREHLVYELWMTNASSAEIAVQKVEVLGDGAVLQTLDTTAIAGRLQPVGQRQSVGTLTKSTQALLFLNVTLAPGSAVPHQLLHRVTVHVDAAPPGYQDFSEDGGAITVDRRSVVVVDAPLRGEGYISADSCCDATRHTRAALAVNGRVSIAQRYAVDWEQMNASGVIYSGPQEKLESYTIFGKQALAVADATVVSVIEGLPEQTPGKYPTNIAIDQADGNSVILDLGNHQYGLYAHLQPGSIKVRKGDHVKDGQVLGLVGNTGNSLVPHLHFHVMDSPSPLGSNGLPYEIRRFTVTGKTPGTEAFDEAESKGTPVPVTPMSPPDKVTNAMPLDQLIITFAER
jgi:hypothetical protein